MTITFENLTFYNSLPLPLNYSNTFRVTLFRDNHVEIYYDKLYSGSDFPIANEWMSGLRSPRGDTNTVYDTSQMDGISEWSSMVPGVYPRYKSDVKSGTMFTACPISASWCMTPNTVNVFTKATTEVLILTTLSISCISVIDFSIQLSGTVSDTHFIPCAMNFTSRKLQCNVSSIVELNLSVGTYSVVPAWRVKNASLLSGGVFEVLPIAPLSLHLFNSSTPSITADCSINTGDIGTCSECDICNSGNLSCLDLPCNNPSSSSSSSSSRASQELPHVPATRGYMFRCCPAGEIALICVVFVGICCVVIASRWQVCSTVCRPSAWSQCCWYLFYAARQ